MLCLKSSCGGSGCDWKRRSEIVSTAVKEADQNGNLAFGPYPRRWLFGSGQHAQFDAVLAMVSFNFRGLIPFKHWLRECEFYLPDSQISELLLTVENSL
ncbi:MAG: 4-hydroxythreonine-4-phosphate dehydrogenase PdxA [Bacteroidetes bacterium]|nr:4-hydroxythreonine-4-phosphate dehydrogenase PdxA [Bacteroidota bacterium]